MLDTGMLFLSFASFCKSYLHFPVKSEWIAINAKGNAPSPRHSHIALPMKDFFVVFGGTNNSQFFSDVHIYNYAAASWAQPSIKGAPPSPRADHTAAVIKNKLFIIGGRDENGPLGDAYSLDLDTMEWAELPGFPPARFGASAAVIGPKISSNIACRSKKYL